MGDLLTPSEVAKELKLNLLTVYKYIRKGDLCASKFGRNYRISIEDLVAFIKNHKVYKNEN